MEKKNRSDKNNVVVKFFTGKIFLIAALICEVIAYLMVKGIMSGDAKLINGLTVAGVILLFIHLIKDGLTKKYRHYSKKWGFAPDSDNNGT